MEVMRRLLTILFLILFVFCLNSLRANSHIEINEVYESDAPALFIQEKSKQVFLDENDTYILDFSMRGRLYESFFIQIIHENDSFLVDNVNRVLLEVKQPGKINLQFKLYSADSGEEIYWPDGLPQQFKLHAIAKKPLITNDAIVLGILIIILGVIFKTSSMSRFEKFYKFVPSLLLCYFIPSIFNSLGVFSGEVSNLYFVSSRYLLPASLILLCLCIDLKGVINLGPKAGIMFLAGTVGIMIGGPLALLIFANTAPGLLEVSNNEEIWRGLSTIAGSWIGGGANQTAMKEIFQPSEALFSAMITADVIVANFWMFFLLYGAGFSKKLDKKLKADSSAIDALQKKMENFTLNIARIPKTHDLMMIFAIGLGGVALSHLGAEIVVPMLDGIKEQLDKIGLNSLTSPFFWLVVFATSIGLILSFTRFRNYEGSGASKIGTIFLYVLVASIGMKMDVTAIADSPGLFAVCLVWMLIHVSVLLLVAKLIRAPFFFVAVGSQANVGGAASAPIVASAFSPALAPVGVLLAVLGYAVGTYGALLCTYLMQWVVV